MTKEMYPDPKFDVLVQKLKAIEEKHKDYFENKESNRKGQNHDIIDNHWHLHANGCTDGFAIRDESDLPEHIKKECYAAFYEVYGEKTQK